MKKIIVISGLIILAITMVGCAQVTEEETSTANNNLVTIEFDSNGGSMVDSVTLVRGTSPILSVPEKEGYVFDGWFTGSEINDGQLTNLSIINKDINVVARWIKVLNDEIGTEGLIFSSSYINGERTYVLTGYVGNDKDVIIPAYIDGKAVIGIASIAMIESNINTVSIPYTVRFIGNSAFGGSSLSSVVFSESSQLEFLGSGVFANNQLTEIIIPESVRIIGDYAFSNNQLTNVIIPEGVKIISRQLFASNQLKNVVIPESVTDIANGAFSNNQLTNVSLPKGLKSIENFAFQNNQLTTITIPEGVTKMGMGVFNFNPISSVNILGDSQRFNEIWDTIGFPSELKIVSQFLIEEVLNEAIGQTVLTTGIVTSVFQRNLTIEDETGAINIFHGGSFPSNINIGDEILVQGSRGQFNGLQQITMIDKFEILSQNNDVQDPEVINFDLNLITYQNKLVSIDGLYMQESPPKIIDERAVNFNLVDETGQLVLVLRIDSGFNLLPQQRDPLVEFINSLSGGEALTISGALMGWFNGPQILPTNISQIQITD